MKKIDSLGLKLCSFQAELFEQSITDTSCSSKIFIRRFMNSELAKRMDNTGFLFEAISVSDAIREVEAQYGVSSYGVELFSAEELHWIGYIYRYWVYTHEGSSRQLYKMVKPDKLRKLYFPYHSLDPAQAIERILEETEVKYENVSDISRGVEVLRKVRDRHRTEMERR